MEHPYHFFNLLIKSDSLEMQRSISEICSKHSLKSDFRRVEAGLYNLHVFSYETTRKVIDEAREFIIDYLFRANIVCRDLNRSDPKGGELKVENKFV